MKIKLLAILFFIGFAGNVLSQTEVRTEIKPVQYFIGLQPGIMPVPFDEFGRYAWDINLIPITLEYAVNRHWAVRLHSIWEIEIRPENYPTVLSTVGLEIAAPIYLSLKNSEEGHRGFFIAPVLTPAYNRQNMYYSLGAGAEAGLAFLFGYKWSLRISAQAGFNLQKFPGNRFIRTVPYTIPVVSLGIWL